MTSSVTANSLNALLAANSPAGRTSLAQAAQADLRGAGSLRPDEDATQLEARSLAVRAAPGTSLATEFDVGVGPDGRQVVRGVTITQQQPGQEGALQTPQQPGSGLNQTTALTDNRPRNFADIQTPRANLNPAQELQIFAAQQTANATIIDQVPTQQVLQAETINDATPSLAEQLADNQGGRTAPNLNVSAPNEANEQTQINSAPQSADARRQLQATAQYQLQSDLVFTTSPVFDAAA